MSRKPKLLDQHDVKEVVRFQEYLRDFNSNMPDWEFAIKYSEYLGMTALEAVRYSHIARQIAEVKR